MQVALDLAVEHHRQGRLEQAAAVYRDILARQPDHADACHLLGVVAHQQGDHARAVELISRAIAIAPSEATFHANLAEPYRALGQLDQAAGCCRLALRLAPDCAEAANHLGLVLLAKGDNEAAALQFREALRTRPGFAMIHNNLATALRRLGDTPQAADHYRQAIALAPGLAEAHSNLGQLLLEQKSLDEALVHCREAASLCPNLPEAHNNLGNVLRELDRMEEAKGCYAQSLRLNPDLALAHGNMGQALQQEGKLDDAEKWYRQALALDPNSTRTLCHLASTLNEQDKNEQAIACYELALRHDPNSAEAHHGLGFVRQEMGEHDAAASHYREAIRLAPDFARAYCSLGTVLEEISSFDEAKACFREALARDCQHAAALGRLAILMRGELPEADRLAMELLMATPHSTDAQRVALHFGLAQVLDADGDFDRAGAHLREANAMQLAAWKKRGQGYDPSAHSRFVSACVTAMTPAFFERVRGFGLETERPVFVVGLPRSGTTLVEQILASHSSIFGAGELRFVGETLDSLPRSGDGDAPAIERLAKIDRETIRRVAAAHLARLASRNASAPRIVDKMPDNYLHLGLISTLFPRATIIHCRRDLRDVAVSCWMTHFRQIRWACDMDHIAARFLEYERLLDHWRAVLPARLIETHYEDTVADLEGTARRLIAACGLEWEPACLAYHETRRAVRTASVRQVRQPIYTRSLARWRNYETSLGPLFARLEAAS